MSTFLDFGWQSMSHRLAPIDVSFVMPVRNSEHDIVDRVQCLLGQLADAGIAEAEVVIVDDGSHDKTCERLHDLQTTRSRLRILRHDRPRGMESAGQTGLERATGRLVLICEDEHPVLTEDLRKLIKIAEDESVVAARAESKARPPSAPLVRRLRAWGTKADQQFVEQHGSHAVNGLPQSNSVQSNSVQFSSVQLIRRPHLKSLASPAGHHLRLESESAKSLTVLS